MSKDVLIMIKGVAVSFAMVGVTGICFNLANALTYTLLGLSIILFVLVRHFWSKHE